MSFLSQEFVGAFSGSTPGLPALPSSPRSSASGRYHSVPAWSGSRYFESAETNRLNESHWLRAADESINAWLSYHLPIIRSRAAYETRQNGMIQGMQGTHADDIVGPDGPTLQVISDDSDYNTLIESGWRSWFKAPTPRQNVSGAAMLKLWVRSLWKNGEFLARIAFDPLAEGPIKKRVLPIAPRRLATPAEYAGDPNVFMGIRFDSFGRPIQYYIQDSTPSGQQVSLTYKVYPADEIIHEFLVDEEDQGRGIPWLNTGLKPAADLRDYDDDVQHASRRAARANGMLCATGNDVETWTAPETYTEEPGTIPMAPPGWRYEPFPATQPAAQYPDYRGERLRDLGRPVGMPLMMIRLDCARYNYSSARLETQNYYRAVSGLQSWISGTQRSTGALSRLVDEITPEVRIAARRARPADVSYQWTWPSRPHVDPSKEANAEETALGTRTLTLTDALAARGKDLETHIETLKRERELIVAAGLPLPVWMQELPPPGTQIVATEQQDDEEDRAQREDHEERIERLENANA